MPYNPTPDLLEAYLKHKELIGSAEEIIKTVEGLYNGEISIDDVMAAIGSNIKETAIGDLIYIFENYKKYGDISSLSNQEIKELAQRTARAIEEIAVIGLTIYGIYQSAKNIAAKRMSKGIKDGGKRTGKITGSMDDLTDTEKKVVNDLAAKGKNVEIIPKDPKSINKTPDFKVDGVKTELKTLQNPNTNTGMKRIQQAFKQGVETVIIDGREAGIKRNQAQEILDRAAGKYPNGQFPGKVEIWIDGDIITN